MFFPVATVCDVQKDSLRHRGGNGHIIPAIITVAGNADLHWERQPAIKVHGFHGESQHLFPSSPLTFFFHCVLFICLRHAVFSLSPPGILFIPNTELDSRLSSVNAAWSQLTATFIPLQSSLKNFTNYLPQFLSLGLLRFRNFSISHIFYLINNNSTFAATILI